MPPRAGLSPERVVDAALAVIDESGAANLTLARVAERTGVATPSLYKHVDGLAELWRMVKLQVLGEVDEALRAATIGRSGDEALRALAVAYRDYLRAHPHRHPFVEVAPDDPDTTAAADRAVEVAAAVLAGYGLSGPEAVHAIRCLRAAVHGFTHLEAIGGFGRPEDIDATFAHLLDMVAGGVSALAARADGGRGPDAAAPPPRPRRRTGQGSTTRARK